MADTKKVKLLTPVTFNGATVEAGEELELHEKNADSLVAEGLAEEVAAKKGGKAAASQE
ncbi:hypothetical protein PMI08_01583 [Brevibacillus sp. CF112]|uniref:DUF7210 family protein n=1 Tax=Brevibacillus TaxID=55080 RepID=UPI000271D47A|nr:hypothetical protein [Brevibacillus sp. CF112]EJL45698.1 hypothetical protein PMI08_01583 [Brevibacillus sp. CF112]